MHVCNECTTFSNTYLALPTLPQATYIYIYLWCPPRSVGCIVKTKTIAHLAEATHSQSLVHRGRRRAMRQGMLLQMLFLCAAASASCPQHQVSVVLGTNSQRGGPRSNKKQGKCKEPQGVDLTPVHIPDLMSGLRRTSHMQNVFH